MDLGQHEANRSPTLSSRCPRDLQLRCHLHRRGDVSQPALSLAGLDHLELPDVHAEAPAIPLVLDEAGVADLRYPITIHLADGNSYPTVEIGRASCRERV